MWSTVTGSVLHNYKFIHGAMSYRRCLQIFGYFGYFLFLWDTSTKAYHWMPNLSHFPRFTFLPNPCNSVRYTSPVHLTHALFQWYLLTIACLSTTWCMSQNIILLDPISLNIKKLQKIWSFALYNFFHSPVISSCVDPNIFLSTFVFILPTCTIKNMNITHVKNMGISTLHSHWMDNMAYLIKHTSLNRALGSLILLSLIL